MAGKVKVVAAVGRVTVRYICNYSATDKAALPGSKGEHTQTGPQAIA